MAIDVLCLRPEADFHRAGVTPPDALSTTFRTPDDPELAVLLREVRALLIPAAGAKLEPALFEDTSIVLAQVTGAGVDRLDEATMKKLGVPVCNVPGGSNGAVADYSVAMAIMLHRRFAWADNEIRAGDYVPFRARMMADNLSGLDGLSVGVVGLGVVGTAVAQAFARFDTRVAYFDPAPLDVAAAEAIGAQALSLDELLAQSDVVTLHVPLLAATKELIGARELALMKPGAVLINAARGGVVDEAALAASLTSGHLGGAAVDVYSSEPPAADNPLLTLTDEAARRLILTPHVAGVTHQAQGILCKGAWENIERVLLRGEAPQNRVY
jgi:phosphoglycerate dehydrogenase-like enzyme